MGKRSDFERKERDYYPTPYDAVVPLFPHLPDKMNFWEPCAGNGVLVSHFTGCHTKEWFCGLASDIHPQKDGMLSAGYNEVPEYLRGGIDHIITNPPWDREILHPMIEYFREIAPTWLLFDADWAYTKQAIPFMRYCHKIVAVGRVKWFPDTKMTGKDNCAWYLFKATQNEGYAEFYTKSGTSSYTIEFK